MDNNLLSELERVFQKCSDCSLDSDYLDNDIFLIIKKNIDLMDYCALLAGGAPNDEFDCESKEISARICFEQSAQEIANVIAEVFNTGFGEHDDATAFLPVAKQIKEALRIL